MTTLVDLSSRRSKVGRSTGQHPDCGQLGRPDSLTRCSGHSLTIPSPTAPAKRAFLTLLSNPPPGLQATDDHSPKLSAYTGPDVASILTAVQNRPRSRSMNGGHSRKGSALGSGGAGVGSSGHTRNGSYGRGTRGSFGQNELRGVMDQANGPGVPPPVPSIPGHLNGGGEDARDGATSPPGVGRPQLGEAAQRHVQGALGRNGGGHAKTGTYSSARELVRRLMTACSQDRASTPSPTRSRVPPSPNEFIHSPRSFMIQPPASASPPPASPHPLVPLASRDV